MNHEFILFLVLTFMFTTLTVKFIRLAQYNPEWECSRLKWKLAFTFLCSAIAFSISMYRSLTGYHDLAWLVGAVMIVGLIPFYFEVH